MVHYEYPGITSTKRIRSILVEEISLSFITLYVSTFVF